MTKDNINPNHYKAGGIETIDLIQDVVKDFGSVCQANILKYGIRANKKHDEPQDDIKKIIRYCEFWLNDLEGLKASGKRSEEIAVFDKLNGLLTDQDKDFINEKDIEHILINGKKVPDHSVKDAIDMTGEIILENKKIVLNELKELYEEGYIFSDIVHFYDIVEYEYPDSKVGKAYAEMSEDDELEVLEEYLKYRKQRRLGDEE